MRPGRPAPNGFCWPSTAGTRGPTPSTPRADSARSEPGSSTSGSTTTWTGCWRWTSREQAAFAHPPGDEARSLRRQVAIVPLQRRLGIDQHGAVPGVAEQIVQRDVGYALRRRELAQVAIDGPGPVEPPPRRQARVVEPP